MTLRISHYNTDVDVYSQTTDDQNNRAADIIEITLSDPDSGRLTMAKSKHIISLPLIPIRLQWQSQKTYFPSL